MFPDTKIIKKIEGEERYDKFAIAGALADPSFEEASCSLLEVEVLCSCKSCNLNYICSNIDELVADYIQRTTVVTENFNFGQ